MSQTIKRCINSDLDELNSIIDEILDSIINESVETVENYFKNFINSGFY